MTPFQMESSMRRALRLPLEIIRMITSLAYANVKEMVYAESIIALKCTDMTILDKRAAWKTAIKYNKCSVIKFLIKQGFASSFRQRMLLKSSIKYDMITFLEQYKLPCINDQLLLVAANSGNFDTLVSLWPRFKAFDHQYDAFERAVTSKRIDIIKWICSNPDKPKIQYISQESDIYMTVFQTDDFNIIHTIYDTYGRPAFEISKHYLVETAEQAKNVAKLHMCGFACPMYPVRIAVIDDMLWYVKWICEQGHRPRAIWIDQAIKAKAFKIFDWLYTQGARGTENPMPYFASAGRLDLMQEYETKGYPYTDACMNYAILGRHTAVIQYLLGKNISCQISNIHVDILTDALVYDEKLADALYMIGIPYSDSAKYKAINEGRLDIIKKLHEYGIIFTSDDMENAVHRDQFDIVKFLREQVNVPYPDEIIDFACGNSLFAQESTEIMEYLHETGGTYSADAVLLAYRSSSVKQLRFLDKIGARDTILNEISDSDEICHSLSVIKFLHEIGYTFSANDMTNALLNNYVDIAEYLYSLGVRWPDYIIDELSKWSTTSKALEFVCSKRVECSADELESIALTGNLRLLKRFYNNGCKCRIPSVFNANTYLLELIKLEHLEVFDFIVQRSGQSLPDELLIAAALIAADRGSIEILLYLHGTLKCPITEPMLLAAVKNDKFEVAAWIVKYNAIKSLPRIYFNIATTKKSIFLLRLFTSSYCYEALYWVREMLTSTAAQSTLVISAAAFVLDFISQNHISSSYEEVLPCPLEQTAFNILLDMVKIYIPSPDNTRRYKMLQQRLKNEPEPVYQQLYRLSFPMGKTLQMLELLRQLLRQILWKSYHKLLGVGASTIEPIEISRKNACIHLQYLHNWVQE